MSYKSFSNLNTAVSQFSIDPAFTFIQRIRDDLEVMANLAKTLPIDWARSYAGVMVLKYATDGTPSDVTDTVTVNGADAPNSLISDLKRRFYTAYNQYQKDKDAALQYNIVRDASFRPSDYLQALGVYEDFIKFPVTDHSTSIVISLNNNSPAMTLVAGDQELLSDKVRADVVSVPTTNGCWVTLSAVYKNSNSAMRTMNLSFMGTRGGANLNISQFAFTLTTADGSNSWNRYLSATLPEERLILTPNQPVRLDQVGLSQSPLFSDRNTNNSEDVELSFTIDDIILMNNECVEALKTAVDEL